MRKIEIMDQIQRQKEKDIQKQSMQQLNPEGKKLAEGKRFTFDVVATPVDPLR